MTKHNLTMKYLFFYILLSSITSFHAQKVILTESFDSKEFNETLRFNTWGNSKGKPDAKFSFTNVGHNDNSCLKTYIKKNTSDNIASKASLDIFGISLIKNKKYKLSYYIKSRSQKDKIEVTIYSSNKTGGKISKFTPLLITNKEFNGNGKWIKQEIIFTATKKNNSGQLLDVKHLGIGFGFNTRKGTFYFDDIKLEQI